MEGWNKVVDVATPGAVATSPTSGELAFVSEKQRATQVTGQTVPRAHSSLMFLGVSALSLGVGAVVTGILFAATSDDRVIELGRHPLGGER